MRIDVANQKIITVLIRLISSARMECELLQQTDCNVR